MSKTLFSIVLWIWWGICLLLFFLIVTAAWAVTFPFDRYRVIPNSLLRGLARLMIGCVPGWSVRVTGADPRKIERPTIVVANHQSFLDLPLVYYLPWPMKWVAKRSLFYIPVLGWIIRMTGHIPIERNSKEAAYRLTRLADPLQQGIPAMIFPEGTRTADGNLKRFKNGAFKLAEKYNLQLLPLVLEGGYDTMPPGSWKLNPRQDFCVSVLEPVIPSEFPGSEAMKGECRRRIEGELQRIRNLDK